MKYGLIEIRPGCGFERNDEGERAAATKEHGERDKSAVAADVLAAVEPLILG
jgi:hypothetical protein